MSEDFFTGASYIPEHSYAKEPELPFPLAEDRHQHEHDNNCTSCSGKYNVPGLSHTRKLFCHFCYRGVCSRCLSYEYFHGETKKIEPMCPSCHSKLIALSENFNEELSKCRMERIEFRKLVVLAQQEKNWIEKERQVCLEELENTKRMMESELGEKGSTLDQLVERNGQLQRKVSELETHISDLKFKSKTLSEHAHSTKAHLEEIKNTKKEAKLKNHEIQLELNELNLKISSIKGQSSEEVMNEEIIQLKSEVVELKQRKKNMKVQNKAQEEKIEKIKSDIKNNDEKIQDIEEKLKDMKDDDGKILTSEEEKRLEDLKKQLIHLDELVVMNEKKLNTVKTKNSQSKTGDKQPHYNSSIKTTSSSKGHSDEQAGCCAKCGIF